MSKISFNPQALGIVGHTHGRDMRHLIARGTPKPIVIPGIRIETILEGLSLTYVERLEGSSDDPAGDIDT